LITGDLASDAKFLLLLLSIIIVPFIWVIIRGKNSTDRERRGKLPMEILEPATKKAGYPGIDYKLAVPVHPPQPDYFSYKEILDKQEEELKKKNQVEQKKRETP